VIDALSNELPSLVREARQPAHASLWLRPEPPRGEAKGQSRGRLAQRFVHPVGGVAAIEGIQ
jgi:hypothetical protein